MPGPLNFDAFLGWVNVTDPNNIPPDARVLGADDLLRYEKLGMDTAEVVNGLAATVEAFDSDTAVAESLAEPTSATRAAVAGMVDQGVAGFQSVIDAVPGQVQAQVPPLVSSALAADTTVAQAAATAVTDEIAGRDLVEGGQIIEDDIALAFVDEDGRRLWLESDYQAKPTPYAATKIVEAIGPTITAEVQQSIGVEDMSTDLTGLAFVVVDEDDRVLPDSKLGPDGQFTQDVIDRIAARVFPDYVKPSSAVVTSGDSMTGGAGGTPYPTHLANLTGWNVVNMGVGGETTTTIAGRMGGRPMLATVAGNSIPASGPVAVTLSSDDKIHQPTPLRQQHSGVNPVQIAGVEGTLTLDANVAPFNYTFTRSSAGTATPVAPRSPVITQAMRDYRQHIHVMWWGTNDGTADMATVIGRQRALIDWQKDANARWLVLGLTIFDTAWDTSTAQFLREYGRRFINLREYFSSPQAWVDSGLTPTQQDLDNQAIGKMPPTLMLDTTHFNNAGNLLVAKLVQARIKEMGWL